jgi:predicted nucleotidyltransferase
MGMMDQLEAVDRLVARLRREASVEGVYLAGSLVTEQRDAWSDIDLGVATRNGHERLDEALALVPELASTLGTPLATLERAWAHTRVVALLYGKEPFPPFGLQVDLVFSRLKHLGEQMPYVPARVLYDRRGRLERALAALPAERPSTDIAAELREQLRWFPFYVHDALKAHARADRLHFQQLLESMRQAIFAAAAARRGSLPLGAKRAAATLTAEERKAVRGSYVGFSRACLHDLAGVYPGCLAELAAAHGVEAEVARLREALDKLL